MVKLLVVYCHPVPDSFSAVLRDTVVESAEGRGHEVRVIDLYAEAFDPVMSEQERLGYHTAGTNEVPVRAHLERLRWCTGLIFVYPTWWYGQPAMLKGWIDRVWVPHATFTLPTDKIDKLVFFNGHGGNTAVMDIVARDLRARHGMLTASCSWFGLFDSADLFDKRELSHGIHAGEGETSVMLAARGHLVDMSLARDFTSRSEQWAEDHDYLGVGSTPVKLGWLIQDLNRDGACGNAAGAEAQKGELLLNRGVEHFIAMLRELDGLSTDDLDAFPT